MIWSSSELKELNNRLKLFLQVWEFLYFKTKLRLAQKTAPTICILNEKNMELYKNSWWLFTQNGTYAVSTGQHVIQIRDRDSNRLNQHIAYGNITTGYRTGEQVLWKVERIYFKRIYYNYLSCQITYLELDNFTI